MIYATKHILIEILVRLPCTVCTFQTKKWKIFTYIDTIGCSTCNFRALDWKRIIHEADSITSNVTFIFYAHLKNYEEFEVYTESTGSIILFFTTTKGSATGKIIYPMMFFTKPFF